MNKQEKKKAGNTARLVQEACTLTDLEWVDINWIMYSNDMKIFDVKEC